MSRLQILVTTMRQSDFAKYHEMNLQTDAVIANQADSIQTLETYMGAARVKLVTTDTRGLSKNRNIAVANCYEAEYLMFSDDDLVFNDGYEKIVLDEFAAHPKADAIKFNINCVSKRTIGMRPIKTFHRVTRSEVSSWGVWALAIRRDAFLKKKLSYNERFGAGSSNYCGEDTIFLQEMFKKGIKLYASPEYVADIDQTNSTWFEGRTERYFTTAGMTINECYPLLCFAIVIRSAYKFSKRNDVSMSFGQILRCYYRGIQKNRIERKMLDGVSI